MQVNLVGRKKKIAKINRLNPVCDRPKPHSGGEMIRLHRIRKKEAQKNDTSTNQVDQDGERRGRNLNS